MSAVPSFASADEALAALESALGYLAAADPAGLPAVVQARCLQGLERGDAVSTAARARLLAAFAQARGYREDADYSPLMWLVNQTRVTKGCAAGHVGWSRRAGAHPRVAAALRAAQVSVSWARVICQWTDKLPEGCREEADKILLGAAWSGLDLRDITALAAEMYQKSRPQPPGDDPGRMLEDRSVRLETTIDGAGVLTGDLTPECAAVITTVLDALSAPAGAEDTRSHEQRYHDALAEAMRRLVAGGLLPDRAGQPAKVRAHISLADLIDLDADSALQAEWIARVRAQWAAARAAASAGGGDGAAWLEGDAAEGFACDASITPVVTGDIDTAVLEDLVRLCVELAGHGPARGPGGDDTSTRADDTSTRADDTGAGGEDTGAAGRTPAPASARPTAAGWCRRPGAAARRWSRRSSARPSTCCPAPAGWPRSCAAGSSAPASAAPACRWTSATAKTSRPRSATRSGSGTSTAASPAAAPSPPPPATCTTSPANPAAAKPASRTASCYARTTT